MMRAEAKLIVDFDDETVSWQDIERGISQILENTDGILDYSVSKEMKPLDLFSKEPILRAKLGSAVSVVFKLSLNGRTIYALFEEIPSNVPSSTCWIFEERAKLKEILEILKAGGWNILECKL